MFGQQRKNVSTQPFRGGTLRRELDAFELSLGGGLQEENQRGWIVPPQQQDWREEIMDEGGLPQEYGLPPPQVGARVGTPGGGRSLYGAGNRGPPRRNTLVRQSNRIKKSPGGNLNTRNREKDQGQLGTARPTPGTGARPRNGAKLPRGFERLLKKGLTLGFPEDAVQYYFQQLTDKDEPTPPGMPSGVDSLEQILRNDAITLEQSEPRETWTPMKFLGQGGYGDVILWQRKRDNGTIDQLAVKNTKFDGFFKDYSSEAHLTRRLNVAGCKNVIQVYDWAALDREHRVRIIYAYYPLGDIFGTLWFYQRQRYAITYIEASEKYFD